MRRGIAFGLLLVLALAPAAPASPVTAYEFKASRNNVLGEPVTIRLVNTGTTTVSMGKTWDLRWLGGDASAFYQWPDDQLELEPGESRVWTWDQRVNACYGECQNVHEGDPAEAGRYEVMTTFEGLEARVQFTLGEYFTMDFRGFDAKGFVVFVASGPELEQMRQQTQKPVSDRNLIVSGLVRGKRAYNPNWKFSMGPYSIVVGEMFMEVCDGRPGYVQRHLDAWRGERWCPWSGYVKRAGR